MHEALVSLVALPVGLGLLGFLEPCTVGSSILFLSYLEGRTAGEKLAQTAAFTVARALLMGVLGIVAVAAGAVFVDYQKTAWIVMGLVYVTLGRAAVGAASNYGRGFVILALFASRSRSPSPWPSFRSAAGER